MQHLFTQSWKSVHICLFESLIPFSSWTKFRRKFEIGTKFWTQLVILEGRKLTLFHSVFVQSLVSSCLKGTPLTSAM